MAGRTYATAKRYYELWANEIKCGLERDCCPAWTIREPHGKEETHAALRTRDIGPCYAAGMLPRNLRPIRLSRRAEPFDSDEFINELKIDGFRALAHIEQGHGTLISRNGNVFHGFADLATWIAEHLKVESAVLDREIACVDEAGQVAPT